MTRGAALLLAAVCALQGQTMKILSPPDFAACGGNLQLKADVDPALYPESGKAEIRVRLLIGPAGLVTGQSVPYTVQNGALSAELPVARGAEPVRFEAVMLVATRGGDASEMRNPGFTVHEAPD